MPLLAPDGGILNAEVAHFYRDALARLIANNVPFLIGGAYAVQIYTEVRRATKDLDVFVLPGDVSYTLDLLSQAGYRTELVDTCWLGKVFAGDQYMDIIFGCGNRLGYVDDSWFAYAVESQVLGLPLQLCPPEEMIWHKAFVMARDRYDGADVAHLLRSCGARLDWQRLLDRFHEHWRVLLSHVVLFGYIYPGHRSLIPNWVRQTLLDRLPGESTPEPDSAAQLCRGTLLSREDFRLDVERWGYQDARSQSPSARLRSEVPRETGPLVKPDS